MLSKKFVGPVSKAEVKNWERFRDNACEHPRNAYISEAGPEIFDFLIDLNAGSYGAPKAIEGHNVRRFQQDLALKVRFCRSPMGGASELISSRVCLILCKVSILCYFDTMMNRSPLCSAIRPSGF